MQKEKERRKRKKSEATYSKKIDEIQQDKFEKYKKENIFVGTYHQGEIPEDLMYHKIDKKGWYTMDGQLIDEHKKEEGKEDSNKSSEEDN